MRFRIDLLQGTELIRQFGDPLIALANPLLETMDCLIRSFCGGGCP
jgi:hypothetical protein